MQFKFEYVLFFVFFFFFPFYFPILFAARIHYPFITFLLDYICALWALSRFLIRSDAFVIFIIFVIVDVDVDVDVDIVVIAVIIIRANIICKP